MKEYIRFLLNNLILLYACYGVVMMVLENELLFFIGFIIVVSGTILNYIGLFKSLNLGGKRK